MGDSFLNVQVIVIFVEVNYVLFRITEKTMAKLTNNNKSYDCNLKVLQISITDKLIDLKISLTI